MVTQQEFISALLEPLPAAAAPLALADAPGAVVRGKLSGQSLSEAFGSVMADPTSLEGRVYGEDITGDTGSGFILEMLTDPAVLASLGTAGLGATLARRASRKGPWKGVAKAAIDPRYWEDPSGLARGYDSPTQRDDTLAFLLERLVHEIEGDYPGRVPGIEPEYSSILGRYSPTKDWLFEHPLRDRLQPHPPPQPPPADRMPNTRVFATVRGTGNPGGATHYGADFEAGTAYHGQGDPGPFGSALTLGEAKSRATELSEAWDIQGVKELIAVAKTGEAAKRKDALGMLRDLFGNGFGTDPGHKAIVPDKGAPRTPGLGSGKVAHVREILSLRKEINTVLHNEGFIDEPMSIHQAVLQEDPGGGVYYGGGSRDIIQKLSPPHMLAHSIRTKPKASPHDLRKLMIQMSEAARNPLFSWK